MVSSIEISIIFKNFALDIRFQNDFENLLLSLSKDNLAYTKNENNGEIEFHFVTNTGYLNNKLVPLIDELTGTKDADTQTYLHRISNILFRYKLSSSRANIKESSFEDFKTYIHSL